MTPDRFQLILDRCGGRQEVVTKRERWQLLQGWRNVFAAGLHQATGRWKHGQFEWHVFSFEHARALCGGEALVAYQAEQSSNLIVCPEFAKLPAVRLFGAEAPKFASEFEDVYVWPDGLAWTMAFTHEESLGLGPYYCHREWIGGPGPADARRR